MPVPIAIRAVVLALVLAVATVAGADDDGIGDLPGYRAALRGLDVGFETGKRYAHADAESQRRILALRDAVLGDLGEAETLDALPADRRGRVESGHGQLVDALTALELDRPVCRQERRTGSNVRTVACISKREAAERRERVARELSRPRGCSGGSCQGE